MNRVRSIPAGRPALAPVAALFLLLSAATSSAQPFQPLGDVALSNGQPNAGRLSWVAPVPLSGGAKIFVASSDGGVWRTLDGGATWDTKTDQMSSLRIFALAVSNDGERVFAAIWKPTRLLRSLDGGDNFTELTIPELAHDPDRIRQLIVDAAHADTVYAVTTRGLMRSTNNGTDWSVVFPPDTEHVRYAAVMAGGQFWVLAIRGGVLYRSPSGDPGSFVPVSLPAPTDGQPPFNGNFPNLTLAQVPGMPNRVYIAYTGFNDAIYRSDNYGAAPTFQGRHPGFLYGPRFAVSSDGTTLYSGEISNGNASINIGANGGQSWTTFYPGPYHPDVTSLATLTSGRVYVGTDGGLWLLDETEDEWQNLNGDMANLLLYRVFTSRGATAAVVGGTQDNGVIVHRGTGWVLAGGGDFFDGFLRADNANIGAAFAGIGLTGLFYIDGNQASFPAYAGPCERPGGGRWAIDPMDPKFVCAASGTLHCSSVGGRDPWCIETANLNARELIIVDSSHAWLRTFDGHVLRTTTGVTGNWVDVTGDLPIGTVLGIDAPEKGDPLHALVLVATPDLDPLVYETTVGGMSWSPRGVPPVLDPGGIPITCLTPPCPDGPEANPQVLNFAVTFAGPMYDDAWFVGTDTGLLESIDFGNTWEPTNLPNVQINDLDTFGGVVTVGTWGRGVYQRDVTFRPPEFHFVAYDPFWWLRHSPVEFHELWASDLFALSDPLLEEVRAPQDGGMVFRQGDETHGPLDFYITPGMPLLLRGQVSGELALTGPTAAPRAVHLEPGWNPVGILDPAIGSASQVIADAAAQGLSLGVVLDGGAQQSFAPPVGLEALPVDFAIDPTGGIWVWVCGEGGVWIPGGSLLRGQGADPVGSSTVTDPTVAGIAVCPDPLAALATLPSDLASRLAAELLICVPEQLAADGALTPICNTAPHVLIDTSADYTACASQPHSHGCAITIHVTNVRGDAASGLIVEFDAVANGRATLVDGTTCPIDATAMDGMLAVEIVSEIDAPVIHLSVVDAVAPGLLLSQESCGPAADAAIGEVLSTAVVEALAAEVTLRVRGLGPICSPDFDTALIDADGDGTLDCEDACPLDVNKIAPGECGCGVIDDFDGDGFVSCGADCDDQDGSIWSIPGEVQGLMLEFDPASGGTLLSWSAPVEPGGTVVLYDTLVASSPDGFDSDGTCLESDDGDTVALDFELPLPGSIRYLLVRAETGCNPGAGPLGFRSDGTARSGRLCP